MLFSSRCIENFYRGVKLCDKYRFILIVFRIICLCACISLYVRFFAGQYSEIRALVCIGGCRVSLRNVSLYYIGESLIFYLSIILRAISHIIALYLLHIHSNVHSAALYGGIYLLVVVESAEQRPVLGYAFIVLDILHGVELGISITLAVSPRGVCVALSYGCIAGIFGNVRRFPPLHIGAECGGHKVGEV